MTPSALPLVALLAGVTIVELPKPTPWWLSPEFVALAELRRAMAGGTVPTGPAQTAEESARHAVFWVLFEVEHLVRRFAARLEAGESVRLRSGVYAHEAARVDFNLRIVEHGEITIELPSSRGAQ